MIRRLFILQIILLAGLSSIWLLPTTPEIQPAALTVDLELRPNDNASLPKRITLSGWTSPGELGRDPTPQERAALAKDTEFYRRDYRRDVSLAEQPRNVPLWLIDELHASIVLSGKELTGSIHALERCLNAQGYNILSATTMKVTLRSQHVLPVRRLLCERVDKDNKDLVQRSISYYWFIGHNSVTSNHIKRGFKDMWDRVVHGYDQRWAYITVTANLNGGYLYKELRKGEKLKEGEMPPKEIHPETGREMGRRPLTPEQADHLVDEFISDIGPDIIKVDQIKEWPDE